MIFTEKNDILYEFINLSEYLINNKDDIFNFWIITSEKDERNSGEHGINNNIEKANRRN